MTKPLMSDSAGGPFPSPFSRSPYGRRISDQFHAAGNPCRADAARRRAAELHTAERTAVAAASSATSILGRVVRVLPGMQSAFIDIGLERTACTWPCRGHLERAPMVTTPGRRTHPDRRPEHHRSGLKGPARYYGARLSTQISIAGPDAGLPAPESTSASRSASRTKPRRATGCERLHGAGRPEDGRAASSAHHGGIRLRRGTGWTTSTCARSG